MGDENKREFDSDGRDIKKMINKKNIKNCFEGLQLTTKYLVLVGCFCSVGSRSLNML